MATFKAEVQNKRADGTYNVRIRVTHNRDVRRMSTNIYAKQGDLLITSISSSCVLIPYFETPSNAFLNALSKFNPRRHLYLISIKRISRYPKCDAIYTGTHKRVIVA